MTAAETKVEELAELRREEQVRTADAFSQNLAASDKIICVCCSSQEKIKSAVNLTKSVEVTRAHLQGQLRNKEAENNRLTVQLRVLYQTLNMSCKM